MVRYTIYKQLFNFQLKCKLPSPFDLSICNDDLSHMHYTHLTNNIIMIINVFKSEME